MLSGAYRRFSCIFCIRDRRGEEALLVPLARLQEDVEFRDLAILLGKLVAQNTDYSVGIIGPCVRGCVLTAV